MRLIRLKADLYGFLHGEEVRGRAGDLFLVFDDTAEAFLKTHYFEALKKHEERSILRRLFRPYEGQPLENKSLLLFFGSAMGDTVVLLPVLRRLKELYPSSRLYITVRPFERHFYYGVGEVSMLLNRVLNLRELPPVDYVVDFSGMAGDRDFLSMGMQEYYYKRLFLEPKEINPRHYKLPVNPKALEPVRELVEKLREAKKPLLLVSPKSPAWVRRLPYSFLKELASLAEDFTLLVAQPSEEKELTEAKLGRLGYRVLNPYMTHLDYFKALIYLVDAVISVDTGTFHLAGSLEKPLVGIFNTFPCSHRNYYPRAVCYQVSYSSPLCTAPCLLSFVPATKENPLGMCQPALINKEAYRDAPPCMHTVRAEHVLKLLREVF
jgi:ADP-heptose:LPS heptosyltransferase